MERAVLENLLDKIHGVSFANVDAETYPSPGILKRVTGKRVLLFSTTGISGYEAMVKRRLVEAGKNPDNFVIGELSWGSRVGNSPLIEHKGKTYLQVVEISPGEEKYFIAVTMKPVDDPEELGLRQRGSSQGLPLSEQVIIRCYDIENITRIALMGEQLVSDKPERAILRIST